MNWKGFSLYVSRWLAALGLAALVLFWPFPQAQAQTGGFSKLGTVTGLTFTDSTGCVNSSQTCEYYVTSEANGIESGPSNVVTVTIPASTGAHSVTLTWAAPASGPAPTGYNVYFLAGPLPPTGLAGAPK